MSVSLEIGDFLGFCDMNGIEALTSDQVERLEGFVRKCQEKQNEGESLVADAIYDRLVEILSVVLPDSELVTRIWEESDNYDFDDTDVVINKNPMFSIRTVKSLDCKELDDFIKRLPDCVFDAHISFKENGFGIRVVYSGGGMVKARTRARASAGRDITSQLDFILSKDGLTAIEGISYFDLCEIRGELVLPFDNFETARGYNPGIVSPFSAVSSMSRDSASQEEWGLLKFVAYEFIADGMTFNTKEEMYDFIEELGFETPSSWLIEGLTKESIKDELPNIIADCESEAEDYPYYTDGLVLELNDRSLFQSMGDNGSNYRYGNIALKVGYWKQDIYYGYVQTIVWKKGKTKLSPVAIIADEPDMAEFDSFGDGMYVSDIKDIANYKELGVVTAGGNHVRRVPLYEPSNMLILDAVRGNLLYFRYGGEAGVIPCFSDGTPLVDGRIQQEFTDEEEFNVLGLE